MDNPSEEFKELKAMFDEISTEACEETYAPDPDNPFSQEDLFPYQKAQLGDPEAEATWTARDDDFDFDPQEELFAYDVAPQERYDFQVTFKVAVMDGLFETFISKLVHAESLRDLASQVFPLYTGLIGPLVPFIGKKILLQIDCGELTCSKLQMTTRQMDKEVMRFLKKLQKLQEETASEASEGLRSMAKINMDWLRLLISRGQAKNLRNDLSPCHALILSDTPRDGGLM